jgi:hypothetical protein
MTTTIGPSTVTTSATSQSTSLPHQRKCFYANGLYWVFFSNGTNILYYTSPDGTTWTLGATASGVIRASTNGNYFSIWFDGTYFYYVWSVHVALYYRSGTPNSNGTITWNAGEQTVSTTNNYCGYPSICVDSNGYVLISYEDSANSGTSFTPYVIKSGNLGSTGTWGSPPSGFPYQLSSSAQASYYVAVIPLTSGKMACIWSYGSNLISLESYTGSGWNATVTSSTDVNSNNRVSSIAVGDNVSIAWINTSNNLQYIKYTYSGNSFGAEYTIQSSAVAGYDPTITADANGNLFVFWGDAPTANYLYYREYSSSAWGSVTAWITSETALTSNNGFSSCYYPYNGTIMLLYGNQSSNPYNVRFVGLTTSITHYPTDTISVVLKKLKTKTDVMSAQLKKLGIIETDSIDTSLVTLITASYSLDVLLKFLGIRYSIDELFKELGVTQTYGMDVRLWNIPKLGALYSMDVRLWQVHQWSFYGISNLYKRLAIKPTYSLSTKLIFSGLTKSPSLSVRFTGRGSSFDFINTDFKKKNISKTEGMDCVLVRQAPPPAYATATLHINNPSGDLWVSPLTWKEAQKCDPAIRPTPLAESEYLDAGSYVLQPKRINATFRLSDAEKDVFESIYGYASTAGSNYYTNFYLQYNYVDSHHTQAETGHPSQSQPPKYQWYLSGWITEKEYTYEYIEQDGRYVRWWTVTATIDVNSYAGSSANEPNYSSNPFANNAITLDNHKLVHILNFDRDDTHPPMIPKWVNQPAEVDSYLWNECVLDIEYDGRMSNDEKHLMEITLQNHVKVNLEDYIHNIVGNVWVSEFDAEFDPMNWIKPWKYTLYIQANNSEVSYTDFAVLSLVDSWGVDAGGSHGGEFDHMGILYMDEKPTSIPLPSENSGCLPNPVVVNYGVHVFYFFLPTNSQGFYAWNISGDACLVQEEDTYDVHTFDRESRAAILIWGPASIIPEYIEPVDPAIYFTSLNQTTGSIDLGGMWLGTEYPWSLFVTLPYNGHYSQIEGKTLQFVYPNTCEDTFVTWWTDNPSQITFSDPTNPFTMVTALGSGTIKAIFKGPDS